MNVTWHRDRAREWRAVVDGITVAHAANTSATGTDNYPWDWYLTGDGERLASNVRRTTGVADTLRTIKSVIWAMFQ